MRFLHGLFVLAVASSLCAAGPSFEVASVKQSQRLSMATYGDPELMPSVRINPGHATFRNQSLLKLIASAWRVKDYQVSGAEWLEKARFDIAAVLPKGASTGLAPEMLQALLAERFKLSLHSEARDLPVLVLVPGKGGTKVRPRPVGADVPDSQELQPQTMEQVVRVLSTATGRPVIDETGLKGEYMVPIWDLLKAGIDRHMAEDSAVLKARGIPVPAGSDISVFDVIQKCGLKLEARKLPTTVLVVDHIERTPSEN